jgi:hypothetical protein
MSSALTESTLQECRALIVNEVDEHLLIGGDDIEIPTDHDHFPVCMMKLPVEGISTVAVLSWRWDGYKGCLGSRNVASAVRQSKKMGIKYLFIDAISIDQSLKGDDLIRQVMAFSTLYRTIPVIAAYDKADEVFRHTVLRPWIAEEARMYRYNPTKLVYVGHISGGGASIRLFFSGEHIWDYEFGLQLTHIWNGSHIETINGLLCGEVGMSEISDLRFIIAPCVPLLVTAYETMSRNDYLLTALLLCSLQRRQKAALRSKPDIECFDRYEFCAIDEPGSSTYNILLDGRLVAQWNHTGATEPFSHWILQTKNSLKNIQSSIGLPSSELEKYEANSEARRCYFENLNSSTSHPEIEIVSIKL